METFLSAFKQVTRLTRKVVAAVVSTASLSTGDGASGALRGQRLRRRILAACDKRFFTASMIGERFRRWLCRLTGGYSNARRKQCLERFIDISVDRPLTFPRLLKFAAIDYDHAFSFAARRGPE